MMYCQLIVLVLGLAVTVLAKVQTTRFRPKITGGSTIDISAVPYQVAVILDNWFKCGGSIIRPSWILTAAHCVRRGTARNYTIRAGSNIYFEGGTLVKVLTIFRHPFYEANGKDNFDAALLQLKTPLEINKSIKQIPLVETEPKEGDLLLISGWGTLEEKGPLSDTLRATQVPFLSRDKCKQAFMLIRHIYNSMFCAGYAAGGRDACRGDSGGPAAYNGNLVGIISWGLGCGRKNMPGVYVNVTMIKPWIYAIII